MLVIAHFIQKIIYYTKFDRLIFLMLYVYGFHVGYSAFYSKKLFIIQSLIG